MAKTNSTCKHATKNDEKLINSALKVLKSKLRKPKTKSFICPNDVKNYLILELAREESEVFCTMFLDAQNRLIEFERIAKGTITQTNVYPRNVVKSALAHNAASVIFAHNHPSGSTKESKADMTLTKMLQQTLALFEVRVLDHIIVAGARSKSFSECGLL